MNIFTHFFTLSLCTLAVCSTAQILPTNRAVDWSVAGYRSTIPNYTFNYNMQFAGLVGDGSTANDAALNAVLTNLNGSSAIIEFPAGNFLFNQTIDIPDNILIRGAGTDSTTLSFNLGGVGDALQISGGVVNSDSSSFDVVGNKGDNFIMVLDASRFVAGDYLQIIQNDSNIMFSSWAYRTYGQIIRVQNVSGNQIFLDSELRLDYDLLRKPYIRKIIPATNVGLECLKVKRLDPSAGQTTNIAISYAANCWIKGVESEFCNFAHVAISSSTNIVVKNSYFQDAFAFGGNGQGYGVVCQATSNECLVENNHFRRLRHSILLQSGANANVFAYNYSRDAYWSSFPNNSAGDLTLHGNLTYANLFESNIVCNIVIDNSHGANGDFNTFLRNRAYLYGIFFSAATSPNQNFIGNEITNNSFPYGLYTLQGSGHFEYGNNVKGTVTPANSAALTDSTYYYYNSRPDFMYSNGFAAIGLPNPLNFGTNPAKERWDFNEILTNECNNLSSPQFRLINNSLTVNENVDSVEIFVDVRNMNTQNNTVMLAVRSLYTTAEDNLDYQGVNNNQIVVNFAPLDNNTQRAVVYINNDTDVEPTETIQFVLRTSTLPATLSDSIITINIVDNDELALTQQNELSLRLFPNPANDILNIEANFNIKTVEFYNNLGQMVKITQLNQYNLQPNANNLQHIGVSNLPIGIYQLKINGDAGYISKTFIKQ